MKINNKTCPVLVDTPRGWERCTYHTCNDDFCPIHRDVTGARKLYEKTGRLTFEFDLLVNSHKNEIGEGRKRGEVDILPIRLYKAYKACKSIIVNAVNPPKVTMFNSK